MLEAIKEDSILANKKSWDAVAPRFFGRSSLPIYGPFLPTEDELHLFGDLSGKKVLEIGCGSGHSLKYMSENGASELWGIDLSDTQIETARALLSDNHTKVNLFQEAMEKNPGIPTKTTLFPNEEAGSLFPQKLIHAFIRAQALILTPTSSMLIRSSRTSSL
ncbi:class I SAM-dependent methyltransferase [Paenibacillus paeoniae]|uniref:Class I SAM-dependent methyltransferase n=1 Tax=Paenibacillus paeoniae TaxID=2292705 RepID=A0A371P7P3_9BACL|nr:class I SAM-dependent methyltransferase [Paenibacillus paeoniae]REK71949.1 class I SAM-dependent methyltransferase [Paenibacillus paeoniae]